MKSIVLAVIVAVLCLSFASWAGKSELAKDGMKTKINGFAPDGSKDTTLSVASQTVDMSNDVAWSAYAPGDCKFRTMSTSTKAGAQKTILGGQWTTRVVNPESPFLNYSGCTSGELERQ